MVTGTIIETLFIIVPISFEWTNLRCFGTVSCPREKHSTTISGVKVWVFGRRNRNVVLDELFERNTCGMCNLDVLGDEYHFFFECVKPVIRSYQTNGHKQTTSTCDEYQDSW